MNYIHTTIVNQLNDSYEWMGNIGVRVCEGMHNQAERIRATVVHLGESCQRTVNQINQSCIDTADRINEFLYQHREIFFFTGCCITTAYFAPGLFFPGFLLSFAGRIELTRNFKNLADYYMKDEVNPYRLNPRFDIYVSEISLGMETIATINTLAVGTMLMENVWTLYMIPFLGGVIAGDSLAKFGMNATNFLE